MGSTQTVSRIALEINGQEIDDFKTFTVKEIELAKQVKLMNKTNYCSTVPRFECEVDYVIPADAPEFDFTQLVPGASATLTVDKLNGVRETYQGVVTLKIGDTEYDSEKEASKKVTFGCTGMVNS